MSTLHRRACIVALALALRAGIARPALADAEASPPELAIEPTHESTRALLYAGKAAEAETSARQLVALAERVHGADALEVTHALELLLEALFDRGRAREDETRALAERSLSIRERALGPDHPDVAASLGRLAMHLEWAGKPNLARPLVERSLAIRERVLGGDHPDVARSLTLLASLLRGAGDLAAARTLLERALAIRETALGPMHSDVASSASALATVLKAGGDLQGARPLYERALAIKEQAHGPDHPDVAFILNALATVLHSQRSFDDARLLYERALAIRERKLEADHLLVAASLNNLAVLLRDVGDLEAARPLNERALETWECALGSEHAWVATSLGNLAILLHDAGDLAGARRLSERALEIRRSTLGPDHPDVATSLADLAATLRDAGDLAAARPLLEEALEIHERSVGPHHPDVARSLQGLAWVLAAGGDHAGARPLFERALAIQEVSLGPRHPDVAASLANLAATFRHDGDLVAARALVERSLDIRMESLGPHHELVAANLNGLGVLAREAGDIAGARSLLERGLALRERRLVSEHPDVATSLANVASLLLATGDVAGALAAALRAENIGRRHLEMTSHALSEREALRYALKRPSGLSTILSAAVAAPSHPATARGAWDAALRSRGLALDEMAARQGSALGVDPVTRALGRTLASARQRLANLTIRGPGDSPDGYLELVDRTRREKEAAERDLAAASATFRQDQARGHAGFDEVAAALGADATLVGYYRYRHALVGTTETPALDPPVDSYLAFVLRAGARDPVVVPLGAASEMDHLVERWRHAVTGDHGVGPDAARRAGHALRARAWDPLLPHLVASRRVVVVPDGALHLVNVQALPAAEGGWLVESGPVVHVLSSERDLTEDRAPSSGTGLLALGGPAFSGLAANPVPAVTSSRLSSTAAEPASSRHRRSGCDDLADRRFADLPGTEAELHDIARLWRRRAAGRDRMVVDLVGDAATESALVREVAGKRVVHVATHGFFLGGACEPTVDVVHPDGREHVARLESPLLHSGLAMAGANARGRADDDRDDGVLTAEEIASLDLSSCEWAVLSACGTGLGDVQAGEGVMGLQRAFAMAGARTVIMSLWSVDDEATRHWMRALYRARLERKLDTAECVREASLAVLRDRRAKGLDESPFWWGAFVASGGS